MAHDAKLFGSWRMTGSPPCAVGYAAHLHFKDNGLYSGSSETAGNFTWWDEGRWQVTAPGQVSMSIANDETVSYAYNLCDTTLTFTDPSGCSFSYRRT